eukprot:2313795-Rhodomonas_salina.1
MGPEITREGWRSRRSAVDCSCRSMYGTCRSTVRSQLEDTCPNTSSSHAYSVSRTALYVTPRPDSWQNVGTDGEGTSGSGGGRWQRFPTVVVPDSLPQTSSGTNHALRQYRTRRRRLVGRYP